MEFYWEIVLKDGTIYLIPPNAVDKVKTWMADKAPILLKSAAIPYSEIKIFRPTSKMYSNQPLLEEAAGAFKSPMYTADGSIQAAWVKKSVSQREYASYYSKMFSYHKLSDDGQYVVIAFSLPVHDIDLNRVERCSDEEAEMLNKQRYPHET